MLNKLAKEIYEGNKQKGFWPSNPNDRNRGELLMLIVSELVEALECDRDKNYINPVSIAELELIATEAERSGDSETREHYNKMWIDKFKSEAKETFETEIADALIRILDLVGALDIDIEWHIKNKLRYNRTRPHKHGRNY